MSRVWFIADTHFGHRNILEYTGRPFDNIETMNERLISNWNNVVRKEDTVFVLGDFALCNKEGIIRIGQQLQGHKTLVMGNHDRGRPETYHAAGFRYVTKHPIVFDNKFLLSHEPMFALAQKGGLVNIYGHVHGSDAYKDYTNSTFCVSVERIYYRPVQLNVIQRKTREYRGNGNGNGKEKE